MREKYAQKGEVITEEFFDTVTHEVSTAAMKYALLSCSCTTQISFDIKKVHHACTAPLLTCTPSCSFLPAVFSDFFSRALQVTSFEDASAPFILYNSTRLTSVIRKFEERVVDGLLPPLPLLDEVCAL